MWGQLCLGLFGLELRQTALITYLCTLSVYMQARHMYLEAQTVEFVDMVIYQSLFTYHLWMFIYCILV